MAMRTLVVIHLNMVEDKLPQGDVCFIRQVLQHLANQQITGPSYQNLRTYKWVFITEALSYGQCFNKAQTKPQGSWWRHQNLPKTLAFFLLSPPFNLSEQSINLVLEVSGT